jgi:hypothetical protein
MNPLLFQCPTTHNAVAVGLRIDYANLRNVQPVTVGLICPLCNEKHEWTLHEGWIEEPPEQERAAAAVRGVEPVPGIRDQGSGVGNRLNSDP